MSPASGSSGSVLISITCDTGGSRISSVAVAVVELSRINPFSFARGHGHVCSSYFAARDKEAKFNISLHQREFDPARRAYT